MSDPTTFRVRAPLVDGKVTIPPGDYPGEISYMEYTIGGELRRQVARAGIYLTAEQLTAFGGKPSPGLTGIFVPVERYLKTGEVSETAN